MKQIQVVRTGRELETSELKIWSPNFKAATPPQ